MKIKLMVVMYHYVRNLKNTRYPEIKGLDVKLFEEQIIYLKRNYNIVSIDDVLSSIKNKSSLPEKAVLLTFDDAYKDHYTYVFPIMIKYNIKGAFYIPTKSFKEKSILDVNKIHFILANTKNIQDIIDDIYILLDVNREKYKLNTNEYYFNKLAIQSRFDIKEVIFVKRLLQVELQEELRVIIVKKLFEKYVGVNENIFWEELYLTKEQILCMQSFGMHFGSHGNDHIWLSSLSEKDQELEITNSLKYLKEIGVDTNNWTMCYPYGAYNRDTLRILDKKNCKLAFTTKVDIANLNLENLFEVPRLDTNDIPKDRNSNVKIKY